MRPDNPNDELLKKISDLEERLEEAEQLIEAIKMGEVDAFAIGKANHPEIFTLQSSDYAYRVLIEESGEGAINVTEDGLIVYTNPAFCEMLNLPYEKVVGSIIFDFVPGESIVSFKKLFQESLSGKAKGELVITGNDTQVPVYMSFTSLQPKLSTVGIIITDLSEKKKNEQVLMNYQRNLESKNTALGKMNTELQSFAHISSHDLQEPLRKIQIMSTRIIETEIQNLSDKGKDLFHRMQKSARRMQTLIDDLLAYSTTNTEERNILKTDINKIIDELKDDFSEELERKGGRIEAAPMCKVYIIPLQFRQVLFNLISNSLKFAHPERPPVINIECQVEKSSTLNAEWFAKGVDYAHLIYRDNGIGFSPEYSEKIFGLFARLHGKEQYHGTGIGLAIVKKIIENHNGIIKATGVLHKGAAFDIYLPHK